MTKDLRIEIKVRDSKHNCFWKEEVDLDKKELKKAIKRIDEVYNL